METIIVKSLKRVANDNMLVIGLNGNREATMNVKWQNAEMLWIEQNVGVGGNFQGELQQKGQYLNVTAVDMTSAVMGKIPMSQEESNTHKAPPEAKSAPNPVRVGLFIKLAVEMMVAAPRNGKTTEEDLCENIQEIKKLEEFTVKLLS